MSRTNSDQILEILINLAEATVKVLKAIQGISKYIRKKFKTNVKPSAI